MELMPPSDGRLTAIAYDGNRFLVAGTNGILFSSENGKDWVRIQTRFHDDFEDVFSYRQVNDTGIGYGCFVAIGKSGAVYGESEGRIWKQIMPAQEGQFKRFFHPAEGWSTLLLDSGSLLSSTYGADTAADRWTRAWTRTKSNLACGTMGAGKWIGVGERGAIVAISDSLIQRDSLHFTPIDAHTRADLHDISWGGNRFVAVGDSGTILSSPTGEAWKKEESGTTGNLRGVKFGFNTFIAIVDNQLLFKKTDGAAGQDTSWVIGDDAVGAWLAPDHDTFQIWQFDSLRADTCFLSGTIEPPFQNRSLPVPALPAWGDKLGDFVPPGWSILDQDSGDLNNDHAQDIAFVIKGDEPGLALDEGEEDEMRFKILGILFGGSAEFKYRLAKQINLITEESGSSENEYPFACPYGEVSLRIFRDSLSLFCGTEFRAGGFWSFEGGFKYLKHDFQLVFSSEYWRNGFLNYTLDSLDLLTGRRRCEKGNEGEAVQENPVIKEDTVSLPEPITFDNFLENWSGISGFVALEKMRKRGNFPIQEGQNSQ